MSSFALFAWLLLAPFTDRPVLTDRFAPVGAESIVNEYRSYGQDDGHVALDDEGNYVVTWATLGDIACRVFEADGTPRTAEIRVNPTVNSGLQDFPMVAFHPDGSIFVVVWNDWHGNDGFQMGCFGRVFSSDGTPLTPETQINKFWNFSQFDPVVAMDRNGSFIVAWSDAGRDGIAGAYMRRFAADFTPLTDDILVNLPSSRSQVDPVVVVDRLGRFVVSWSDASPDYGEPRNVMAKVFAPDGRVLVEQFRVHQDPTGLQRHPCLAIADGGRWVVTWQDEAGQDGDGKGVFARVFEIDGTPVSDDIQVAAIVDGDQWRPAVGADGAGNFVVIWEDLHLGHAETYMHRFDRNGNSLGGAQLVNTTSEGYQGWPYVDLDDSGQDIVTVFTGAGEVWTRRYRTEPLTIEGGTTPGSTATIQLNLVGMGGDGYIIAASFDTSPSLDLGLGRQWNLRPDGLFFASLYHPNSTPFHQMQGFLSESGAATATIDIPQLLSLAGLTLHIAGAGLVSDHLHGPRVVRITEPVPLSIR